MRAYDEGEVLFGVLNFNELGVKQGQGQTFQIFIF